jgi:hypothetical protein
MKKLITLLLFGILISNSAFSQTDFLVNKTCNVYKYFYKFGKAFGDGELVQRIVYNEKGQIIKKYDVSKNEKVKEYKTFEYNEIGLLVKEISYNPAGIKVQTVEHSYNFDRKEESEKTYNKGGFLIDKTEYKYCGKADWCERTKYNPQGMYSKTIVEKFTTEGKRLSGIVLGKNNVHEFNFEIKTHDKFGNETEKIIYKPDATFFSSYTEEYNDNNQIIWKIYKGNYKSNFIYDQNNILFQEIKYNINTDEPQFLFQYQYK